MVKKSHKKRITVFIVVSVLIIAAAGAYYWFFVRSASEPQSASEPVQVESKPTETIATIIASTDRLQSMATLLQATNLADELNKQGPYTLIAFNDEALANSRDDVQRVLTDNRAVKQQKNILQYHIIQATLSVSELVHNQHIPTLGGKEVVVEKDGDSVYFVDSKAGKAKVINTDIQASNGNIFVIDAVLLPQ